MEIILLANQDAELRGEFNSQFIGDLTKEEWKNGRSKYIGGSESFALVGNSEWDTPYTLYCKKVLNIDLTKQNEDMLRGVSREKEIVQELRDSGRQVFQVPFLFTRKDLPFIAANIDGVEYENNELIGVEIKSVRRKWSEIPEKYYNQCQHYMYVLNTNKHRLIADCNGNKQIFDIERNNKYISDLKDACVRFWECITEKKFPDLKYVELEKPYLDAVNRYHNEQTVVLNKHADVLDKFLALKKEEKDLKAKIAFYEIKLRELIGINKVGIFDKKSVSYNRMTTERFDSAEFKKDHPKLYDDYKKRSEYTTLGVKDV